MALIFELTQLSPTMEEGTFVRWTKKVGDAVEPGDILAEVETDKAVMEMEAYDSGILLVQLSKPGDRMPVGSPMGIIGEAGEDVHTLLDQARERLKAGPPAEKTDAQDAEEDAEIIARHEKAAAEPAPVVPEPSVPAQARSAAQPPRTTDGPRPARVERSGRILASPLARRIAEDKNVDLSRVKGSGPGGRITREDVLRSLDSRPAGVVKRREDRRIDISSMRRVIARRLHDAKNNIPHFYLNMEIDATAVEQLRRELNADLAMHRGEEAPRVSLNDFIVRASALALVRHPVVNSSWQDDHIMEHGRVDVGVAVAIDGGLVTPYVRDADQIPFLQLVGEIRSLVNRARDRRLKVEEFSDGTFTISNLGMFGIDEFSAIINEPEAALLAVGGVAERPVVRDGAIVPGPTFKVTLSCDHRVIDGAEGARFLGTFKNLIEHPRLLLAL
ncbi:MAG: 2-oxo acid dehydrogenase subunit E2 [Spirochaetales bacterium]|nr:2-oxo acid dehydrogenase subunit E2 [Spirochaetales bacterium]